MPIEVNLDAYIIPDDHRVWKCSPGKTYRFYRAVRDANAIFPDVRGLDQLQAAPRDWSDADLLRLIAEDRESREAASVARGNKTAVHHGITKSDRGVLTFVKRIWFEAKRGDLVVVPAEGYDKEVLIGELLTDAGDLRRVEASDGEYQGIYFGRPVAWRLGVRKFELSADLIKALHTRAAVFMLGESRKRDVYRLAYGNFVYKGDYVAEFRTEKEHFTAEDAAVITAWLNGLQVLRHSLDTGAGARDGEAFYDLALDELPGDAGGDLKININSPGEISFRTAKPLALSLMVLFALSACDPHQVVNNGVTVHLKSVAGAANDPQLQVQTDVNGLATALGEDRLEVVNKLGKRASKDALVSTRASVKG